MRTLCRFLRSSPLVLRAALAAAPLALLLAACDTQPTLDTPDVNGRYVGFGGGYTWEVDLAQSGTALTGTGTLTTPGGSFGLAVTGAHTFPSIGLSLDASPLDVFTFNGRVSSGGAVLTGTMESAAGFDSEMSFQRQ
jgi:hypothetical protein